MTNILFLTCHDLGRYLECYRAGVKTPNIDRLAGEGVLFERAFSTSSGCSPARAALATGRYPHSNGVMGLTHPPFDWDLRPGERHVAAILGEAGFETHLFGFQHVSSRTSRLGFQLDHSGESERFALDVAELFERFVRSSRVRDALYLEVNLEEVHRPFPVQRSGTGTPGEADVDRPGYLPDDSASRMEMASLNAALARADRGVGRILNVLESVDMAADTLVVFTTDHGLAMPRAKCTLYDPGLEIGLVMRWPEHFPAGLRFGEMLSNIDVLPTILEAVGVLLPESAQGRSFLPLIEGRAYETRTEVFAEKSFHSYYDPMRAIRTERFKLIRNFETTFAVEVPGDIQEGRIFREHVELYHGSQHPPVELYDLREDPWEQQNLAEDQGYAAVRADLDSRLWEWMDRTEDPLLDGPIPSPAYLAAMGHM